MARESELLDPVAEWLRRRYGRGNILLVNDEASGRGGRRPDILAVSAPVNSTSIDDATLVPVEVENSTKGAIHDRRNGLQQLRKYPGHKKYLAIPSTVARMRTTREIVRRCERQRVGLLVVDPVTREVECWVGAGEQGSARTLRTYRSAMKRFVELRGSGDRYRRISRRQIVERG